jgi:hypothetical protein
MVIQIIGEDKPFEVDGLIFNALCEFWFGDDFIKLRIE